MIITISGSPGSGKSTVAKEVARRLGFKHYSYGDFMRKMAEEKGISFKDLIELAVNDSSIDHEIDSKSTKLVEEGHDNFVVDARLGFHFIPTSIKLYLAVDVNVAAKRVFNARRHDERYDSEDAALVSLLKRKDDEIERYLNSYNLDCHDLSAGHYDFIIDTTELTSEEVVKAVLKALEPKNRSI